MPSTVSSMGSTWIRLPYFTSGHGWMLRMTSRLHVTNQTAATSTGCPKGPGIESRWQAKEKRQGMALGEERQEGRVGVRAKKQPSRTGHTQGGVVGGASRRRCWGGPLPISEPKGRPTHLEPSQRHKREGLQ